jgi:Protein of unknown function (DUF1579)
MEMPKPGDAHKRLAALIGEWSGPETLSPSPWDPAGGTAIGTVRNVWIADGFGVAQTYEQKRDGKVNFLGHGVFSYDPSTGEYAMRWWDSMGGNGSEYRGTFDGNTLVLGAPMAQGGHARTSWEITGPNSHTFLMQISQDGENWMTSMEGRYKKGGAKKGAVKKAAAKTTTRKAAAPRRSVKPARAKKAAKKAKKR